jgi:hypothetical protein
MVLCVTGTTPNQAKLALSPCALSTKTEASECEKDWWDVRQSRVRFESIPWDSLTDTCTHRDAGERLENLQMEVRVRSILGASEDSGCA